MLLAAVAALVAVEAVSRLSRGGREVLPGPMLLVAALGPGTNIATRAVLRGGRDATINIRGAYLEVPGDLLGAVAAVAAALVILATGFLQADALASLLVVVLIVPRAFLLLRDVLSVLTESAPDGTVSSRSAITYARRRESSRCTTCAAGRSPTAPPSAPRTWSAIRRFSSPAGPESCSRSSPAASPPTSTWNLPAGAGRPRRERGAPARLTPPRGPAGGAR
ncbi:MAG: cation transporter [Naasia sp.]|nr:cation transporter [Naasia sp.]